MPTYKEFHRRSLDDRDAFWREQAALIDWQTPFSSVLDYSTPAVRPVVRRRPHQPLPQRGRPPPRDARRPAGAGLHLDRDRAQRRPTRSASCTPRSTASPRSLKAQGVGRGDRVLIYMPMIAEAAFAMLACARIGAIHSVVFGGFAAASLATRIDDAKPKVMVTADAGMRGGKPVPYKHLVDEAIRLAQHPPAQRGHRQPRARPEMAAVAGRDLDYATLRAQHMDAQVPCEWLESSEPSYILYTSGTTGKPKGVQRDTGGYAVALASSMRRIFCVEPGETMFTTSDIGWVVGHSYIVYGPLINGIDDDHVRGPADPAGPGRSGGRSSRDYKVNTMFSSPTAIRVLKKQDPAYMHKHDLASLQYLFLAGEPLDEPTARWAADALGVAIVDNYWQTETGWPILSAQPGVEQTRASSAAPSFPVYGYDVQAAVRADRRARSAPTRRRVLTIQPPLPPGCMTTIWGDDERFVRTYFSDLPQPAGLLDVRLGDARRGRLLLRPRPHRRRDQRRRPPAGHARDRGGGAGASGHRRGRRGRRRRCAEGPDPGRLRRGQGSGEDRHARGDGGDAQGSDGHRRSRARRDRATRRRCISSSLLPKTRSGKLLRRSIQALAEGRDPGDLTTIEDPAALEQIRAALASVRA